MCGGDCGENGCILTMCFSLCIIIIEIDGYDNTNHRVINDIPLRDVVNYPYSLHAQPPNKFIPS